MLTVNFIHLPLQPGSLVLDLGCGEGRHAIALACSSLATTVGVDLNETDLLSARQKKEASAKIRENSEAEFVLGDALSLPFGDACFDAIICSEVLEHIFDYQSVLDEISRVLRPGGFFCVSVPRMWPEKICWVLSREYHEVPGGHVRIFCAHKLQREIEGFGMTLYHRHWAHALHAPFWWLKCIFWRSKDTNWLVVLYHRLLVWDLMTRPRITRFLESLLNPFMGKSVVLYFRKDVL